MIPNHNPINESELGADLVRRSERFEQSDACRIRELEARVAALKTACQAGFATRNAYAGDRPESSRCDNWFVLRDALKEEGAKGK